MIHLKFYRATLFAFLLFAKLNAQTDSLAQHLTELAEQETEITEYLQRLQERPVNINAAGREELMRLPFITPEQADRIIAARKISGQFHSIREIRPIVGAEIYAFIREFIATRSPLEKHGLLIHKTHYSIDQRSLPRPSRGNALYDYNKIHGQINDRIRAGFITQKDPGEPSYLDYFNSYISYNNGDWQLNLGSYRLQYGEGLIYSRGMNSQKSAEVMLPFRWKNTGGQSTLSSAENSALFGIYIKTPEVRHISLNAFYSNALRDGQLNARKDQVTGINYEGYHRTTSEIARAHLIREQSAGLAMHFNHPAFGHWGALISNTSYDPGLNFSRQTVGISTFRRQYYRFSGDHLRQYSLFWNYANERWAFSSEWAGSDIGSPGYSGSILLNLPYTQAGLKLWRVTRNFQSPGGRIFDDANPFPQAEQGVYLALEVNPATDLRLLFYRLMKKDLWRNYFSTSTELNSEWLMQGEYHFRPHRVRLRLQQKSGEDFAENEAGQSVRITRRQLNSRVELELRPGAGIYLRTRWESTRLNNPAETGNYLFQETRFHLARTTLLTMRVTCYRTVSYNSRLYEYESDLPGSFSNYALYGEGYKWYLLVKYAPWERLALHAKWRCDLRRDENLTDRDGRDESFILQREIRFMFQIVL
jgi:hypothetical protein